MLLRLCCIGTSLALVACAQGDFDRYQKAIGDFGTATAQVQTVTSDYILEMNEFERQVEFTRLRHQPDYQLDVDDKLLADTFSPESIILRQQVFSVLTSYTDALGAIAGSTADQEWQKAVSDLRQSAVGLAGTLQSLRNQESDDQLVGAISEPAAALVSAVGTQIINMQRSQALDRIVTDADPAIAAIMRVLRNDLEIVFAQRRTGLEEPLTDLALRYREVQQQAYSPAREQQRTLLLTGLQSAVADYKRLGKMESQIGNAIDALDQAREELVSYARSSKTPQNLAQLVGAMDRAAAIAEALFNLYVTTRQS